MEELKDIIVYIRSVEDHRTSRFVHFMLDVPDAEPHDALRLIHELWPDEKGPRFTVLAHKEEDSLEQA